MGDVIEQIPEAAAEEIPEDPDTCCGNGEHQHMEDKASAGESEEKPQLKLLNEPEPVLDPSKKRLRIAVAGCAHGEMDKIYATLAEIEKDNGYKFDLLICCGDYQSVRNFGDLHHMHVNEKYRSLQTFYKYYSGEVTAPILTLFIGGNHEASGFLGELPNGGWVAPRIYYMGFANVIRFAGLRIGGLSGIYNPREFNQGHFERPPFINKGDIISAYHVRNIDVWRLKQLRPADDDTTSNPLDIMLSHDWPAGITDFGDVNWLLRIKPYFKEDISKGKLGNPATMQLLYDTRPRYWLSAHMHIAFPALVPHETKDGDEGAKPTKFLALDKPLPGRQFIQALEFVVDKDAATEFSYDREWLAILKSTDKFTDSSDQITYLPSSHSDERYDFRVTPEDLKAVEGLTDLTIPENFRHTAPPLKAVTEVSKKAASSAYYRNPQSAEFCTWLGISDLNKLLVDKTAEASDTPYYLKVVNDAELKNIKNDAEAFGDADFIIDANPSSAFAEQEGNNEEETQNGDGQADAPSNPFLEGFEAPTWKGDKKEEEEEATEGDSVVPQLKRRKVDINEDE